MFPVKKIRKQMQWQIKSLTNNAVKLRSADYKIIIWVLLVHLFVVGIYLYLQQPFSLTSRTYMLTVNDSRVNGIEKTMSGIINSPDFTKDLGLEKQIIQAADRTPQIIELKTSAKNEEESINNFKKYEPLILEKILRINSQLKISPVSSAAITQEVMVDYFKLFLLLIASFCISLVFIFSAKNYLR